MPGHALTPAEQAAADQATAALLLPSHVADQALGDTQPPGPWSDAVADQACADEHLRRVARGSPTR